MQDTYNFEDFTDEFGAARYFCLERFASAFSSVHKDTLLRTRQYALLPGIVLALVRVQGRTAFF